MQPRQSVLWKLPNIRVLASGVPHRCTGSRGMNAQIQGIGLVGLACLHAGSFIHTRGVDKVGLNFKAGDCENGVAFCGGATPI